MNRSRIEGLKIPIDNNLPEKYIFITGRFLSNSFFLLHKRDGEQGMEKFFGLIVKLHPGSKKEKIAEVDTMVKEKHFTLLTDTKLQERIMEYLRWIDDTESI